MDLGPPLRPASTICSLTSDESIARAFNLRKPVDGGYPVGYVVIDSSGFIRFRTLDPGYDKRVWEIVLLLGEI